MLVLIKPSTENFHLMSINVQLLEGAKLQVVVDEDAVQVFQTKHFCYMQTQIIVSLTIVSTILRFSAEKQFVYYYLVY